MSEAEKYFAWPDVVPELPEDEDFYPFIPPRKRNDPRHKVLNHISEVGWSYTHEEVKPSYHLHELARDLDVALDSNQPLMLEIKLGERLLGLGDELGRLYGCMRWLAAYTKSNVDLIGVIAEANEREYARCEEEYKNGRG